MQHDDDKQKPTVDDIQTDNGSRPENHLSQHAATGQIPKQVSPHYPWLVLSVTSLGVLLTLLNVGTLNVALPTVANHFGATSISASWILLSYMLANTVLILVFGRMADIFGRKKMYLAGFIIFTVVSLLIGVSPNVGILILLRMLQAAGGALIITNTTALLTDSFPEHILSRGLGINVLVSSVAQLVGPVLGGYIAYTLGWRWVFWFNVPIGVIGVVWAAITLREGYQVHAQGNSTSGLSASSNSRPAVAAKTQGAKRQRDRVDWLGNIIIFVVLSGLILSLSEGGVLGWANPVVIAGIVVFVAGLPLFIVQQKRSPSPIIDFALLQDRIISLSYIAAFFNNMVRTSVVLLIALFFESIVGVNSFGAGLRVLPVTIGLMLMSPIAGALTGRFTSRLLSSIGLALAIVGLGMLLWLGTGIPLWITLLGMFLVGAGSGLFLTPNTTLIMTRVPVERRGIANGLRSMLQNMGQVVGTALSLMLVTAGIPTRLKNAVYAGRMAHLNITDVGQLTTGFHWALGALMIGSILGLVASVARK